MGVWRSLFADLDFTSLPGPLGRFKVDGKKVLDFVPPPPPPAGQVWTRRRVCHDPYCRHFECERADEDDIGLWYAPERLQEGAKFDENLRYPMPAAYLKKKLFPYKKKKSRRKFKKPVPKAGRPWPEGPLCMPTPEQAKRFVMSHPQVIEYLLDRKLCEIGVESPDAKVQADFGPCIIGPNDVVFSSWLNVTIDMKVYRLAALRNDVILGRYTVERALRPGMEGSQKCHRHECINPFHSAWEISLRSRLRGGPSNYCLGSILYRSRDGKSYRECMCKCGDEASRCITEKVVTVDRLPFYRV